jgi:hypothetical protein
LLIREFRKVSRKNCTLLDALEEFALLAKDPHGCSGQHPMKKLEGVKPGRLAELSQLGTSDPVKCFGIS